MVLVIIYKIYLHPKFDLIDIVVYDYNVTTAVDTGHYHTIHNRG
jgi:hypothetical protein